MKNNAGKVFVGLSVLAVALATVLVMPGASLEASSGGFALAAHPSVEAISITGPTALYRVSIVPANAGFTGRIVLSCATDSPRVSCQVSPASVTIPSDATVPIEVMAGSSALGTYHVVVTGTSGGASSSAAMTLLVG